MTVDKNSINIPSYTNNTAWGKYIANILAAVATVLAVITKSSFIILEGWV